jgi:hypothetical protein
MDSEIRTAMMQAAWERRELDHELLGPDHLLLGLLSNVRGTAYKLLGEYGVTYEWARRVVADKHDDSAYTVRETETPNDLEKDREALRVIGIDLDKVRDAVREAFGEDITDRWGERRERRERGERGGRDRGRRGGGPRGRGPQGPHDRGARGNGPHGHAPHGPDAADDEREDSEFDAFARGFGDFGPGGHGRGRRGPRSRRFEQVAPSMHRILHQLRREMHDTHSRDEDGDHPAAAGTVLAALLTSGDPAIEAVIDAADDPKALRAAVEKLAGHATA